MSTSRDHGRGRRRSKRAEMLDHLEDQSRELQRAVFAQKMAALMDDLPSDSDSDSDANVDSDISMSDVSSISSGSGESSSGGSESAHSATFSDIEDSLFISAQELVLKFIHEIETTRVLDPLPRLPKVSQLPLLDEWRGIGHPNFRKKLRVDPDIFDGLLALIQDHHIFHNNSNNPQLPVQIQLAIFLYRAGHYGNGSSPEETAEWAGVAVGTVVNATNRVMVAVLTLHDEAVHYPPAAGKESAKQWVEEQTCPEWRDGWLMGDGTKVPLFERPGMHGDAWFDKNKDYSLDLQVFILPDTLFIADYSVGHTGSVHDSYAFLSTRTYKEHGTVFAPGEWLWADSAYPIDTWCVAPYKKPMRAELTADQRTFNYHISKVRIRVEHAIGLLKGRFQSLKELRIHISGHKRHMWALMWIRTCVILHNLIIRLEEGRIDEEWREELYTLGRENRPVNEDESSESDEDEQGPNADLRRARRANRTDGERFRRKVMDALFDSPHTDAVRRPN